MTYDLGIHEFIENGPAATAIRARSSHSTARFWRALDADVRLAAVERAMKPANDTRIDDFPIAL
jgi:hypothetical protein